MKKKLLCVLLGISMIGTMSGCSSKSSKKEETVPKEESILPDKYEKQHREVREPVYRTAATAFAGGDGSESSPYEISSAEELQYLSDLLADKVVTEHGDFAAYYAVNLEENGEGISSIPVTVSLMNEWGVSVEQIQADAMMADKNRGVQLVDMTQIIESMIFGGTPKNLLNEKLDMETVENPMFCLTNESKMNGASLLLQEDIRKQIGECLGSDYFVIPSSVHEVLILPDNGILQVPELNAMVQEVNETQVERQEQLSDKVQFCDKKTAVLENAERREARLEKEKVAEKAEVKGGIHGRLEKAKAEIKAKEINKAPKDKAKNLAEVL